MWGAQVSGPLREGSSLNSLLANEGNSGEERLLPQVEEQVCPLKERGFSLAGPFLPFSQPGSQERDMMAQASCTLKHLHLHVVLTCCRNSADEEKLNALTRDQSQAENEHELQSGPQIPLLTFCGL